MVGEERKVVSAMCQKAASGTDFPVRSLSGARFSLLLSLFTFYKDDLSTTLCSSIFDPFTLFNLFNLLPPTWET